MDKEMAREHLQLAEKHVAQRVEHIARQVEIIAELERDGHDTAAAKGLLDTFEETQATHVAHRARLIEELAGLDQVNEPPT